MISPPKQRGFTLIELLVVIAIIAILAAILFPVFAQAREKARQATCVSNNKQLATAALMYIQDNDEQFPFAFGNYPGEGWQYAYVGDTPYNWECANGVCGPKWTTLMQGYWLNSIQPYTKNFQVGLCPSAPKDVGLTATQGKGAPAPQKSSYAYNGLLMSYSQAGIAAPASLPMITEGLGAAYLNGFVGANPVLICDDANAPCVYKAATADCAGNGGSSDTFNFAATAGVHGRGQTYTYTDGHAKFKKLSLDTQGKNSTDYRFEPWTRYSSDGKPTGYWSDDCHVAYFAPNYDYQQ